MNGKKLIIIGGGVSSLVSGIFALKKDYQVVIYEKNSDVGGLLLKNNFKKDYLNDSFTYFYYDDKYAKFYSEIGLDNIEEIENDFYLQYHDTKVYKDLNKLEEELISKYILDEKRIKTFIKVIQEFKDINLYYEKPYDCLGILEPIKYNNCLKLKSKLYNKYHNISIDKYFSNFESKEIKEVFVSMMQKNSSMYNLIMLLALYCDGRMKRLKLSSFEIAKKMKEKFLSLGGRIECNKIAEKIDISKGKAIGVWFNNKHYVNADYIISGLDLNFTYKILLNNKYNDKVLEMKNLSYKDYPTFSLLSYDFLIKDDNDSLPYIYCEEIDKKKIASTFHNKLLFINRGNGIISCNVLQSSEDYVYWKLISKNPSIYKKELTRISNDIKCSLENIMREKFELKTNVKELSCISPLDYEEKFNCFKGCVYSYGLNANGKIFNSTGRINNLKNLYLASQWMSTPGGILNAMINGYYAVLRLEFDRSKNK